MATPLRRSVLATEYVLVPFPLRAGGEAVDPTDPPLPVDMAFTAPGVDPGEDDWVTASWGADGGAWLAHCLVGPEGDVTLPVGRYDVWVKVTASPEVPVELAPGRLVVF